MILETSNSFSKIFVGINAFFSQKKDVKKIYVNTKYWTLISKVFSLTFYPRFFDVSMTMMPNLYLGLGKKNIFWLHDTLYFNEKMVYGDDLNRFRGEKIRVEECLRKSEIVVVPSEYSKFQAIELFDFLADKIYVQYCQIELTNHNKVSDSKYLRKSVLKLNGLVNEKYILFIGSPHYRKNLRNVLKAFDQIRRQNVSVKLVVISYPRRDIPSTFDLYDEIDLRSDILKLNTLGESELLSLIYEAELLLSPSLEEGFGLPNIEAQLFGVPVVSSNISCLPEILGNSALLVDPNNVEDIAEACLDIIFNRIDVKELRRKGKVNAEKYSNISEYENLYQMMKGLQR
jgi:glycosyltransferase involved in cell wall biosynthesis